MSSMRTGNMVRGLTYVPWMPLQWIPFVHVAESPSPTWLDFLKRWDFEAYQIEQEENKMALIEFEPRIKDKERHRSELLQQLARLEGVMSTTTKVEQGHLYDLLNIVREIVAAE